MKENVSGCFFSEHSVNTIGLLVVIQFYTVQSHFAESQIAKSHFTELTTK